MNALAGRLDRAVREATDRLIALHGLSGRAAEEILARVAGPLRDDPARGRRQDRASSAAWCRARSAGSPRIWPPAGSASAPASLHRRHPRRAGRGRRRAGVQPGASAPSRAQVGWSAPFLTQRFEAALLRYLAVAHFGRGRGDWVEGEYPPHWQALVEDVVADQAPALSAVWARAEEGEGRDEIERALAPLITAAARRLLIRLYPDAEPVLIRSERPV